MSSSSDFSEAVDAVLRRLGTRRRLSPSGLLAFWEQFVDEVHLGYRWSWFDYQDELSIRDILEAVMRDRVVATFPEAATFADGVARTDARFRDLTRPKRKAPDAGTWWAAVLPAKAGRRLADDVRQALGEEIEPK